MSNTILELATVVINACNSHEDPNSITSLRELYAIAKYHGLNLSTHKEFIYIYSRLGADKVIELDGYLPWPFFNENLGGFLSYLDKNNFTAQYLIGRHKEPVYAKSVRPDAVYLELFPDDVADMTLLKLQADIGFAYYRRHDLNDSSFPDGDNNWFHTLLNECNQHVKERSKHRNLIESLRRLCDNRHSGKAAFYLFEAYRQGGSELLRSIAQDNGVEKYSDFFALVLSSMLACKKISATEAAQAMFSFNDKNGHIPKRLDDGLMRVLLEYRMATLDALSGTPMHDFFAKELPLYLAADPELDSCGVPAMLALELHKLIHHQPNAHKLDPALTSLYEQMVEFCTENPNSVSLAMDHLLVYRSYTDALMFFDVLPDVKYKSSLMSILIKYLTDPIVGKGLKSSESEFMKSEVQVDAWPDEFLTKVAIELDKVFGEKDMKSIFTEHPGIVHVFRAQANAEQWDMAARVKFAKRTRSAPVSLALIKCLDIPATEFGQFSSSIRRMLLSEDLGL